jgi:hypothetical protein
MKVGSDEGQVRLRSGHMKVGSDDGKVRWRSGQIAVRLDRDRLRIQLQGRDEFSVSAQYVLKISDRGITESESKPRLGIHSLVSLSLALMKNIFPDQSARLSSRGIKPEDWRTPGTPRPLRLW